MKGLPVWMHATLVVLTVLVLVVGWDERHHAGYLPFILGIGFALFTLASIGATVRDDGRDER